MELIVIGVLGAIVVAYFIGIDRGRCQAADEMFKEQMAHLEMVQKIKDDLDKEEV